MLLGTNFEIVRFKNCSGEPDRSTLGYFVKKSNFCYQGKLLMMFKNLFFFKGSKAKWILKKWLDVNQSFIKQTAARKLSENFLGLIKQAVVK